MTTKIPVSGQMVYEVIKTPPTFTNKAELLDRIIKSASTDRMTPLQKDASVSDYVKDRRLPVARTDERPSPALAELPVEKAKDKLREILKVDVLELADWIAYDPAASVLALNAEGMLGAEFMTHFFKNELEKASPLILAILKEERRWPKADAEAMAYAFLFTHVAQNGIDCLFDHLTLKDDVVSRIRDKNGVLFGVQVQEELRRAQVNMVDVLYSGSMTVRV